MVGYVRPELSALLFLTMDIGGVAFISVPAAVIAGVFLGAIAAGVQEIRDAL